MKKLNTIIMAVLLAMLVVFASGCGNAEIDIVKNEILGNYQSLTVGNALDNYSHFSDREWNFIKTENGKKVVEFRGAYDIEPLLKNTDIEQFYLLIQFTINADNKSFYLSYIGREEVFKDGKIKNFGLEYHANGLFNNIYQNKDTLSTVAPFLIRAKLRKCSNGKSIGELIDNYKYLKSGKWFSKNDYIYFHGVVKVDKKSKSKGVKKQEIFMKFDASDIPSVTITQTTKNNKKHSLRYSMKYTELANELLANKELSYVLDTVRLFKNSKKFKQCMECKSLHSKRVLPSKKLDSVIFSAALPQTEVLKQAGIESRRILLEYNTSYVTYFQYKSCTYVDKYKDGKEKRFNIQFDNFGVPKKDIAELFSPINLLYKKEPTWPYTVIRGYFSRYDSDTNEKFIKCVGNRSIYEFSNKLCTLRLTYSLNKSYSWLKNTSIYLLVQGSVDIDGNNFKIENIKFKIPYDGKDVIIKCSKTFKKESALPNPLYYITKHLNFPKKWFKYSKCFGN